MKSRMFVYCSCLWFMKQANFQKKWGRLELGVRTFFQLWMKNKRCKARHKTFHLKLLHHQEIVFVFLYVEFVRYTTICLYFTAFSVPRYIRVTMWILIWIRIMRNWFKSTWYNVKNDDANATSSRMIKKKDCCGSKFAYISICT